MNPLVANTAHGLNQRFVVWTEFGPQAPDVDVNRVGTAEEVVAPDLLEQFRAGKHATGMLSEVTQQFELFVGEVQRPGPQPHGVGVEVD